MLNTPELDRTRELIAILQLAIGETAKAAANEPDSFALKLTLESHKAALDELVKEEQALVKAASKATTAEESGLT